MTVGDWNDARVDGTTTMPLFPLAVFGRIDWAILAIYLAGMVLIGHVVGRKKTNVEGYFLAERSSPIWAVVLSTMATTLSTATFVGVPELSFGGNLTYLILNIGGFLAVLIVGTLFIPRFYRTGSVTIYGYIDRRFGEGARVACSAMFIVGRILASGARLFFAAIPVSLLLFRGAETTPRHLIAAILLIGAMGIAYTVMGGLKAVIWTDSAQIIIVVGAAITTIVLLLHEIPLPVHDIYRVLAAPGTAPDGHSKLFWFDTSTNLSREYTIWVALLATLPLNVAAYGVDHDMAQRMLTAKSAWRGGFSVILAQVLGIFVVLLFLVIGLLLYIFYTRPDVMGHLPSDPLLASAQVYPQFLLNHLPTGLAGIAMAGLFAAAQGSLDSAINAMASSLIADLYWPLQRLRGRPVHTDSSKSPRLAVAAMGGVLILFAIASVFLYDPKSRSLINFALGIMAFAYSGMLAVFLTALFTRRGSTTSVLAALAVGVIVVAALQEPVMARWAPMVFRKPVKLASFWHMPIGAVISFIVCLCGSQTVRFDQGDRI